MARETMTSEERLWAAIRLEKPDRVPIDILATGAFSKATGGTVADFYRSEDTARAAIDKVWDYTGGWDLDLAVSRHRGSPRSSAAVIFMMGVKMKFPGKDLPENYTAQVLEQEVMKREDYDTVAEIGWQRFVDEDYQFRLVDATAEQLNEAR